MSFSMIKKQPKVSKLKIKPYNDVLNVYKDVDRPCRPRANSVNEFRGFTFDLILTLIFACGETLIKAILFDSVSRKH